MEEMARNISNKHVELTEVEKNIRRKQTLLDITSQRMIDERKKIEVE